MGHTMSDLSVDVDDFSRFSAPSLNLLQIGCYAKGDKFAKLLLSDTNCFTNDLCITVVHSNFTAYLPVTGHGRRQGTTAPSTAAKGALRR